MPDEQFDLTDWHSTLVETLGDLNAIYRDEDETPHDRQKTVLAALATTVIAISGLPGLNDKIGPLFSLLFAYQALTETGKSDPLLVNYIKSNGGRHLSLAHMVMQGRSASLVEIMFEAGWKEKESIAFITDRLVEAGVKGKNGRPITRSSVRAWRTNAKSGDYPETNKHMRAGIDSLRSTFKEATGRWPPSKEEAKVLVADVPQLRIFRDFANSAASSITAK